MHSRSLSAFIVTMCFLVSRAATAESASLSLLEAIEQTLANDPSIRISASQVESQRGSALVASGRFDTVLSADVDATDSVEPTSESTDTESRSFSESLTATRRLRSGQTLQPSLQLLQPDGEPEISVGTIAFTLRQPLIQGRRSSVVTAVERAADRELAASRLDLAHRISERLLAMTNQYWTAKASIKDLEILTETEERSRELLETTRRLVDADVTPAAELIQLEADLVFREASRISAEQALFAALQNLGGEIGLTAQQIARLGLPTDPFPTVQPDEIPDSPRALLAEARASRADLAAARQRLEADTIRLRAARDNLKPLLDLEFTPSFTGLVEGDGFGDVFSAPFRNIPGFSASINLSYSFPLANRVAEGALLRSESLAEQQALAVESSELQIDADVPIALDAVRKNAERLLKLERAVELFGKTLENEEKKLRVGSSTLIDVLNQRDRLTAAQQRLVSAQLALARAISDLRFETGTLVRPSAEGVRSVRVEDLTILPLRASDG